MWAALLVLAMAAALGSWAWRRGGVQLDHRLASIVPVGQRPVLDCRVVAAGTPLVLLVLGQSNAANHGGVLLEGGSAGEAEVTLLAEGHCLRARDPLPGGTGRGGSIWSRLERALQARGLRQPVVLSLLAVDASSIDEWTRGPLKRRLSDQLAMLRQNGLPPAMVLWQQGEADARIGTSQEAYVHGLLALDAALKRAGLDIPLLLAKSTRCRSGPSAPIRAAIDAALESPSRFKPGPDTDDLSGSEHRSDGCHFTAQGLDAAADRWAESIVRALPGR